MRDPARIPRLLAQIEHVWRQHPDMRLCQLIGNAFAGQGDLYHVDDDVLEVELERLYGRLASND